MANITLSGTLLDPNSGFAARDKIRFTHKTTTGSTLKGSVSTLVIGADGAYSIDLQYGLVLVERRDSTKSQYINLGVVTVNADNPATTLPELLSASVPVSSEQLIEFQSILADCLAAQAAAEAAAAEAAQLGTNTGASLVGTSSGATVQQSLDALTDGQTGGVIVFSTYALLDAYTPQNATEEKSSFKVTNDSNTALNGYYSWVSGTAYTKDASLVINTINEANTSDAVSGSAVYDYANNAVTWTEGLFKRYSVNLLNQRAVTTGNTLDVATGELTENASFVVSEFIEVHGGGLYSNLSNNFQPICYYDEGYVFISGSIYNRSASKAPLAAKYVRIALSASNLASQMFCEYWVDQTDFIPYDNQFLDGTKLINHPTMNPERTIQLFNKEEALIGYDRDSSGVLTVSSNSAMSHAIPCREGYYYQCQPTTNFFWFFDETDTFISRAGGQGIPAQAPAGASYFYTGGITMRNNVQSIVVTESTLRPIDYINYEEYVPDIYGAYKSKWYKKSWFVLGDSISTGDGTAGALSTKPYSYLLGVERQINVANLSVSGRTIAGNNADDINMQISGSKLPPVDDAPDLITVFAGTNDYGYSLSLGSIEDSAGITNNFYSMLKKICEDVQTKWPTASFGFISPLLRSDNTGANAAGHTLEDYVNAMGEVAELYNVPFLNLYKSCLNYNNSAVVSALSVGDGLHPNDAGQKVLAARIGVFIESI